MYERPYNIKELKDLGFFHLLEDEVHLWRAKTGIELIHKEPTKKEQIRIWENWKQMPFLMKMKSDLKSNELFGMTNEKHHKSLIKNF